jgi:hypothetical protein
MTSHNGETTDPGAMNISAPAPAIHPTTVTTPSAARHEHLQYLESQRTVIQQVSLRPVQTYFTSFIINEWVPCILSPAQVQGYLQDTRNRIKNIHALEAQRNQLLPGRSQNLDETIYMAHLEYKIHFGRIFRINDLPPNILTDIFQYIIWSSMGQNQRVNWHLWLTWVCRHWREVAFSDPMLWNAIWFYDAPKFERSFAYFERSAGAPLDIRINAIPLSLAEMQYLLNRLFEKISNLRTIVLVLQEWNVILFVLQAFCAVKEKNIPMILERFAMHRTGSNVQIGAGQEYSYFNPISLFGGATVPSLKYLCLNGIHIDWANLALTNLTNIDMRRIPLDKSPTLTQFRELLGRSPALRELFLDGACPSRTEFVPGIPVEPIPITSLRVLTFGGFSLKYALYVRSLLSTPNVLDLTLLNLTGEDFSNLYDALRSTMPLIRILSFDNIDFVPTRPRANSIIKWLQSMPQVTYFRIGFINPQILELFLFNPKTMAPLVVEQTPEAPTPEQQTIPCPKLAFLEVVNSDHIETIIRWARVRKHFGSPLQKVYVRGQTIPFEQSQRLGAMLGSGGTIQYISHGFTAVEEKILMDEGEGIQSK